MIDTVVRETRVFLRTFARLLPLLTLPVMAVVALVVALDFSLYFFHWRKHSYEQVLQSVSPDGTYELVISTHMLFDPFPPFFHVHDAGQASISMRRRGVSRPLLERRVDLFEYDDVRSPEVTWRHGSVGVRLNEYVREIQIDLPDSQK